MTAAEFLNTLAEDAAHAALMRCCGATNWVAGMLAARPFVDDANLFQTADRVWRGASPADVREALTHHPEIGAGIEALRAKFHSTASWSEGEQAGVGAADEATLLALRDGNVEYHARFGHIFVVCATGKTAAQMLDLLRARLPNEPEQELLNAAAEQGKITRLRLAKLASDVAS
ncbi:MAG: 2-oxo-4-hydroxy-4-carboxy-5-ureidoimidazoline decarboxylase [Nannocystales bacterium]